MNYIAITIRYIKTQSVAAFPRWAVTALAEKDEWSPTEISPLIDG